MDNIIKREENIKNLKIFVNFIAIWYDIRQYYK